MNDKAEIVDPTLINPNDVLCRQGKGKHEGNRNYFLSRRVVDQHPGNQALRDTIESKIDMYDAASVERKIEIAYYILSEVECYGGRFYRWNIDDERYYEMTDKEAVRHVRMAFANLRHRRRKAEQRMAQQTPITFNDNDVIAERGVRMSTHPGNHKLFQTMQQMFAEFETADIQKRREIADGIVLDVKRNGGRFLKWDMDNGRYYEMTNFDAGKAVQIGFENLESKRENDTAGLPDAGRRPSDPLSLLPVAGAIGYPQLDQLDQNIIDLFEDKTEAINKRIYDEGENSAVGMVHALLNEKGGEQLAQTILSNIVNSESGEAATVTTGGSALSVGDQTQDTLNAAKRILEKRRERPLKRVRHNENSGVEEDESMYTFQSGFILEDITEQEMHDIKIENKHRIDDKARQYTGSTMDEKPHGTGFMIHDDGKLMCGQWRNGLFQGQGFAIYENGDKCFGYFENNMIHGFASYISRSYKYVGNFYENQRHGKGTYKHMEKGKFDGDFVEGRFEGLGVHTAMNGTVTRGRFENWEIKEHIDAVSMDVADSEEPQAMLEQLIINHSSDESKTTEKTGDQIVLDTRTVLTPEQRLDQKLQAKGAMNPEVASTYNSIARVLLKDARLEKDPELYEAAIRQYQKVLPIHGPEHISTAGTYDNIGNVLREQGKSEEAMKQYQKGLEIKLKVNGADDISIAETHDNIGHVMREQGKSKKAMEQYQKGLEIKLKVLGQEHSSTADSYFCIGGVSSDQDMNEVALENYEQALNIFKKANGPEHPSIALTHHEIANVLCNQGKWEHASERYFKALVIKLKALGPAHYSTATTYHCIGNVLCNQGRYYEALERYQTALEIKSKARGPEHSSTISTYQCIGNVLRSQGRYEAAMHQYEKVLKIQLKVYGPENASTAASYHFIGNALCNQGLYDEAMQHHQRSLDIKSKVYGPEHPATASTYQEIGTILSKQGKTGEAMRQIQKGLDIFLRVNGSEHSSTAAAHQAFGEVLQQLGRIEESSVQFEKALSIFRNNLGDNHPRVAMVYNCIAKDLAQTGHQNKAVELLEKAVKIQLKNSRDDHPDLAKIYATMSDISNTEDWERDGNQAGFQALDDVPEVPEEVPILENPI